MSIDGYVCTCFAYGQTGSGKTYTMTGPAGGFNSVKNKKDKFMYFGLIPRSINYLFNRLRQITLESNSVFYIRVSYYEIYNEQIRDLINPSGSNKLEVRGTQEEGFFVDNLFSTYIETMDELLTILEEGELNRVTAAHLLNEHSSRSHAILTIQIENETPNNDSQIQTQEQVTRLGKLIFVDLAGSEKSKVTLSKGKQLVETNNINKSLLVLGTCISALSDPNNKDGHIPYRNSKLTRLLSESLGGTGITLMIANISPSGTCENETLNTLRYANRAQTIENAPLVKIDSRQNVIEKLKRELRKLKNENQSLKMKLESSSSPILYNQNSANNSTRMLPRLASRNGSSHSTASNESELFDKLKEYMAENKTLKSENNQLAKLREKIRQQHEVLSKENEKLARKLEQVLREQGKPSMTEYIVVDEQDDEQQLPKIHKSHPNYVTVIENNTPQTVSTKLVNSSSPRKVYMTTSNGNLNNGNQKYIEEYEIVKPSYSRKFKQMKESASSLKRTPSNRHQAPEAVIEGIFKKILSLLYYLI